MKSINNKLFKNGYANMTAHGNLSMFSDLSIILYGSSGWGPIRDQTIRIVRNSIQNKIDMTWFEMCF